ncbi:cytochrome C oxidase subunit IV family protein [Pseudomaricurvus alkylphenolicus]|jgi:hypothetical protein|uniref:cytochrome C oxidase subunit IV family protein n=1 Tax=Pseudomaricurvus alkylphenolicus TaxID=1306991 RepID=UPI001421CB6D|nr:cytochrome C oxidase subunit IV family protein [Pseudomaricurvus alkylphenolicus]NIB44306.1 cytochrome C oxidase subunit IV family protein [Pseudomaricurvus alkylphenolicus]
MSTVALSKGEDHTKSLIQVWTALVVLTLLSWWFRDHGLGPDAAVAAILFISFVKVYLVGHSFMELKFAPSWLRHSFTAWCSLSCLLLITLAFVL